MAYDAMRKRDLEELAEGVEHARTQGERDYYKRIMFGILNETEDILYWREELLRAVRVNEKERKNYCIEKIQRIKQDQTAGKTWGSNKGNRYVN